MLKEFSSNDPTTCSGPLDLTISDSHQLGFLPKEKRRVPLSINLGQPGFCPVLEKIPVLFQKHQKKQLTWI